MKATTTPVARNILLASALIIVVLSFMGKTAMAAMPTKTVLLTDTGEQGTMTTDEEDRMNPQQTDFTKLYLFESWEKQSSDGSIRDLKVKVRCIFVVRTRYLFCLSFLLMEAILYILF
jgi:hypothetical protein